MNSKINVLYIDDEPLNLDIFKISLNRYCNVFTANSGKEGLKFLKNNPYITHVISDFKMPGMDGIEFITIAKTSFPRKQYYILSGYHLNPEFTDAIQQNVISEYFEKPLEINKILRAMSIKE